MKSRVYDSANNYITECAAIHSREDNTIYISGDKKSVEGITGATVGNEFLLHYTDATQGVIDFRCRYDGFEQEGSLIAIAMKILDTIKTVQRRQDLKMRTNIPIKLTLLDPDDKITVDPETKKDVQYYANLRDISAGGVMIDIETPLDLEQKLLFNFDKGSSPAIIQAQVLREQPTAGLFHRYGCQFYNLASDTEAVVREYVFRLEASRNFASRYSSDV